MDYRKKVSEYKIYQGGDIDERSQTLGWMVIFDLKRCKGQERAGVLAEFVFKWFDDSMGFTNKDRLNKQTIESPAIKRDLF